MQGLRLAALGAYRALFGMPRTDALVRGWRDLSRHPEAIRDLCMLGHIFEADIDPATGKLYDAPELIARAARKSLALTLLARAEVTNDELNQIRKENLYAYGETDDADGR